MGVALSTHPHSIEAGREVSDTSSIPDVGSSPSKESSRRGRRAASNSLQGPARRGPEWRTARRLAMQEGECTAGKNPIPEEIAEIVVSFEYHCQTLWQGVSPAESTRWRGSLSPKQGRVSSHSLSLPASKNLVRHVSSAEDIEDSIGLCSPGTPDTGSQELRRAGAKGADPSLSCRHATPAHINDEQRPVRSPREDDALKCAFSSNIQSSPDTRRANHPADACAPQPSPTASAGSTFSFLSGAALCANTTLANSILCKHAAKSGLPPPVDSPRAFLQIGSLSCSSPSLTSCSSFTSGASCTSSSFASSTASSLANAAEPASCSSAPDSFGPSFLSAQDVRAAGGAAGEDRVHAVCSEASGWVFCGVYDGFNGRDAADFLASSLWESISAHLRLLQRPPDDQHSPLHSSPSDQQLLAAPLHQEHGRNEAGSPPELQGSESPSALVGVSRNVAAPQTPPLAPADSTGASLSPSHRLRGGMAVPTCPPLPPLHPSLSQEAAGPTSPLPIRMGAFAGLPGAAAGEGQEAQFQRQVLGRLQQALAHTEREFFRFVQADMEERPDLAMVGSCVLVLLIHGPYLFTMNLGDSRALLASAQATPAGGGGVCSGEAARARVQGGQYGAQLCGSAAAAAECCGLADRGRQGDAEGQGLAMERHWSSSALSSLSGSGGVATGERGTQHCCRQGQERQPMRASFSDTVPPPQSQQLGGWWHGRWSGRVGESGCTAAVAAAVSAPPAPPAAAFRAVQKPLYAVQLSEVHCCDNDVERRRVLAEHGDDGTPPVAGDRVKGKLRVTRAFGAGYLKSKKLNDALMGIFRIKGLDTPPYISSLPFVHTRRLGPLDRFVVAGSDGLFDFFSNEEVVGEVAAYLEEHPLGDPAKHMLSLLLEKAAQQAGIPVEELRSIPSGRRRKYHDDVTIVVIILGPKHRTLSASTTL